MNQKKSLGIKGTLFQVVALFRHRGSRVRARGAARAEVQEEHPHTRGKVWEERHKKQRETQKDLGYNI